MKKLVVLVTLLFVSITFAQEETPVDVPKIAVKIPLGETVQIADVTIRFVEVLEDSRCPTNVTCVWAGEARIVLEMSAANGQSERKEVTLKGQVPPSEMIHTIFKDSDLHLYIMALNPYPTSALGGEQPNYTLLVCHE
ncbi:MAG: hypothetical protein MK211_07555 [Flavobacteriales bacterium]|jgi:hypothetical protein|uniref:hypothetical protein n=1 Tax=Candidatus Ulvibacter alkanivorans TaxID=2267620 RepID=UPI000DF17F13|nr:hypothetical protein [Candidatus Ulvibacter alkanivorans]MCH2489990.1 hypothetical protein [Flavobacteriales bacterium]